MNQNKLEGYVSTVGVGLIILGGLYSSKVKHDYLTDSAELIRISLTDTKAAEASKHSSDPTVSILETENYRLIFMPEYTQAGEKGAIQINHKKYVRNSSALVSSSGKVLEGSAEVAAHGLKEARETFPATFR